MSYQNKLIKRIREPMPNLKKIKCMINYKLNMANYWTREKGKRMTYTMPRFRVTRMLEINSWKKREEDADRRIKTNSIKNRITYIDSEMKWNPKKQCNWRRENKREITSKKCFSKMSLTKEDRRMKKNVRDSKT